MENKCDVSGVLAMQLMMGGGDGGPMMEMMTAAGQCNPLPQSSCGGADCEWKEEENKCDVNGLKMLGLMMGGDDGGGLLGPMLAASAACGSLQQAQCTGEDCSWKAGESKCDVSPMASLRHMGMEGNGPRREPSNSTPMGVNSMSFGSPHVRCTPMGRTCGA